MVKNICVANGIGCYLFRVSGVNRCFTGDVCQSRLMLPTCEFDYLCRG